MKNILTSTIFILVSFYAKCADIDLPEFAPRTPDVAALEKFGDYPVGYNTGTVGINVPLFSFSLSEGCTLPISLSYHSSGIKITDVSGRVGAGWTFIAGGCISREVRGLKDEEYNGFYRFINRNKGYTLPKYAMPETSASLLDSINNKHIDTEPDMFYLTLPSGSYKFFYGNDCRFHTIPYSNLKIEQNALDNSLCRGTWTVTDENGIKYIYGVYKKDMAIESSRNCDNGMLTVNAWKLMGIVSSEGFELASFKYAENDYTRTTVSKVYRVKNGDICGYANGYSGYEHLLGLFTSKTSIDYEAYELSEVKITDVGMIDIKSNPIPKNYCHMIAGVTFTDAINGKKTVYNLSYDDSDRQYLLRIDKETDSGDKVTYRKFKYYDGLPDSYDVCSQDYWGYFNRQNNTYLFPNTSYFEHPSSIAHSDRYPNKYASCGSLEYIYYPTGGRTQFEYENNEVKIGTNTTAVYNIEQTSTTCNLSNDKTEGYYMTHLGGSPNSSKTNEKFTIKISYALQPVSLYVGTYKLVDADGKTVFETDDVKMSYNATRTGTYTAEGYIPFEYSVTMQLNPGTYKWVASYEINSPKKNVVIHPATITSTYYTAVKSNNPDERARMVGGIRIKSISNYDCDNKLVEKRNFYYVNDKGESSGVAGPEPLFVRYYVEKYTKQAGVGGTTIADDLCIGIEEVNGENLCRYTGSAVLYSQVIEETQISEETKYRTKYCYKNAEISYPYASPNLFKNRMEQLTFGESGYREGILTNTIINKTGENSDYKPIQNNVNYTTILEKTPYTFVQRCISLRNILGYNEIKRIPASEKYYYGTYELVSAKILPTQTEIYQYLDGDTIVQTTKNVYENDDYIYPTRTEVYAGNGNKIISDYRYSFDYTDDEAINVLKSRNVISQPIRVSTKYGRSSTIIDTKYARFGDSLIKPSLKTSVSKGDTIEVEYLAYDSYGNLLYAKLNDIHAKFYLWSYCGKLPIAEITGGDYTYAQIVSAITTAFGLSINELSSMATPNADVLCNGKLQSLLPKANVTTFTYDSANCVATITDTNGLTNKYEYDDFDRLTRVMSPVVSDGGSVASAIVKSYEYNYKGVEE